MNRTVLQEFGGLATLSKAWAQSLMKFTKRRGTTKSKSVIENFDEVKSTFLQEIVDVVAIEAELSFNWDQTGLNLVPGRWNERGRREWR